MLRLRLRSKLLLGVFAVVCAAMAVQFVILSDRVGDDLAALERQRMDEDLAVAVNALEQMNTRLERAAAGASVDRALAEAVVSGDGRWIAANVLGHVILNERVQSAVVLTAEGDLLRSAGLPLPDLGEQPLVRMTAAKVVSSTMMYRGGRLWVLAAAPIVPRGYDDESVGALVLGVLVCDSFAEALKSVVGTEMTFLADGVVMGASDRALARRLVTGDALAVLERQRSPLVSAETASKARALVTPGVTTYLVVSNHRAPIATASAAMRRSILISLWPGLVLAAIVATFLSIAFGRSLSGLTRAVDAMAFGDLSTRVTPRGEDEFADLGHAFNAMAQRVEEAQETLWRAAVRDSLTGLLNHREFYRRLEEEVARADREGQEVAVLMIDLDDFKSVNDTYGHLRGDSVLREMARALESCVREQDVLARYAGDEFAVVLTATGERAARAVAERIRGCAAAIGAGSELPADVAVTASIGVAARVPGVEPLADLMERADQALYRAKAGGRDRVVVAAAVAF
ncbi:MAG: diguanylate cyclase [Thermoleophilia bacterium]|nr:diguanylate cyclase [Thermoleophilia bacterium]